MSGGFDLSWMQAAGLAAAFFVGGFVKGGLGFGLPLVVMSIIPNFVPLDLALAVNAVVMPFTNLLQFAGARRVRETVLRFWPLLAGLFLGAPIGAALVAVVDPRLLAATLGLLIAGFVIWSVAHPTIEIPSPAERPVGGVVGVAAGLLGTLTTINGPVFIGYLLGLRVDRQMMISALGLFFLVSGVLIAGSFVAVGILDVFRAVLAVGCIVPAALGMWAGNHAARHLPPEQFRAVVLVALLILGINMTLRALLSS